MLTSKTNDHFPAQAVSIRVPSHCLAQIPAIDTVGFTCGVYLYLNSAVGLCIGSCVLRFAGWTDSVTDLHHCTVHIMLVVLQSYWLRSQASVGKGADAVSPNRSDIDGDPLCHLRRFDRIPHPCRSCTSGCRAVHNGIAASTLPVE